MPRPSTAPDTLAPVGVTTWAALLRSGYTPAAVRAQLAAKRWRRWGHAIVLHNGPLSRHERWWVARAHAGNGALLTAFTAAEAYGLRGWERDDVHVLTGLHMHGWSNCPVALRLHRMRDRSRVRRHPGGPVHFLPQALLVAAGAFDSPRPACGILAAAVQQRLVSAEYLETTLLAAPRARHRGLLLPAVRDMAQGAHALSEIDFVRLCRRFALPLPEQQTVRTERDGRRRYLDATWRRRDGRLVVVEVDGALHLDAGRWWDDQHRQNELVLGDAIVLRFPSVVVRTQPNVVAAQLRRALLL